MTTQENILDELSKELLVEFIKKGIRATYPPKIAEMYCRQGIIPSFGRSCLWS